MTHTRQHPPRRSVSELAVPQCLADWLRGLDDLAWLHLAGADGERLRVVVVMLHGDEPSGIRALHRWLLLDESPATDVWVIVGAVQAALSHPPFSRRFLPEHGDLNRCWTDPPRGPRAEAVAHIMQALSLARKEGHPEALLDLHNNTGHNPPYGVAPRDDARVRGLVTLFGRRLVHSPLNLGTLVDAAAPHMTSVTIECGRAGDPEADDVAFAGLSAFLRMETLEPLWSRAPEVELLADPIRVVARPGVTLRFDHERHPEVDLTLDPEIDRHNFTELPAGTALGWVGGDTACLEARDASGIDRVRELFAVESGRLIAARAFCPVMMTTSVAAALADCLFYVVHPVGE